MDLIDQLFQNSAPKKKKKVDHEALASPLNRIPGIDLKTVRDLIDLGIKMREDLYGRAPEVLFEDLRKLKGDSIPPERLWMLRLAVYYVETPEPEQSKLTPWAWQE